MADTFNFRDKKMMYKSSVDDDDDGAPSGW